MSSCTGGTACRVRRDRDRRALERNGLGVFGRAGRTFAPSAKVWHRLGDLLSDVATKGGLEIGRVLEVIRAPISSSRGLAGWSLIDSNAVAEM
jgi:hypothetical protein